jgi:hypothetical protein
MCNLNLEAWMINAPSHHEKFANSTTLPIFGRRRMPVHTGPQAPPLDCFASPAMTDVPLAMIDILSARNSLMFYEEKRYGWTKPDGADEHG